MIAMELSNGARLVMDEHFIKHLYWMHGEIARYNFVTGRAEVDRNFWIRAKSYKPLMDFFGKTKTELIRLMNAKRLGFIGETLVDRFPAY